MSGLSILHRETLEFSQLMHLFIDEYKIAFIFSSCFYLI